LFSLHQINIGYVGLSVCLFVCLFVSLFVCLLSQMKNLGIPFIFLIFRNSRIILGLRAALCSGDLSHQNGSSKTESVYNSTGVLNQSDMV